LGKLKVEIYVEAAGRFRKESDGKLWKGMEVSIKEQTFRKILRRFGFISIVTRK